jgi:plastocyanin
MGPNGDFRRTFTVAGTFNYRCTIHAGMDGTIIVQ